jgi:hypothetical protein
MSDPTENLKLKGTFREIHNIIISLNWFAAKQPFPKMRGLGALSFPQKTGSNLP